MDREARPTTPGCRRARCAPPPPGSRVPWPSGFPDSPPGIRAVMERIVVAAKAGADQPWVADAAAELAQQTGAEAAVVSVDGVDLEALSPLPRSEYQESARESANKIAERI